MERVISFKGLIAIILVLSSQPSLACGPLGNLFTGERVPLSYVGNVSFQAPVIEGDIIRIPINFTGGKWLENSGRVLSNVKSKSHENEIRFTVETCLAGGKEVRPEIKLEGLPPGKYNLIYQNPDNTSVRLGEIEIKR